MTRLVCTLFNQSAWNPVKIWKRAEYGFGEYGFLGQKSCRTKVARIFRIFVPNFAPNFAPNFPEFFEDFSCFVSWETENRKSSPKITAVFQCKTPRQTRKKYSQTYSWRAGKVTVSNTKLTASSVSFFCPHQVSGRELSEFLSAYYLCAKKNSPFFFAELNEFTAELSKFTLPKEHSRNSIPILPVF